MQTITKARQTQNYTLVPLHYASKVKRITLIFLLKVLQYLHPHVTHHNGEKFGYKPLSISPLPGMTRTAATFLGTKQSSFILKLTTIRRFKLVGYQIFLYSRQEINIYLVPVLFFPRILMWDSRFCPSATVYMDFQRSGESASEVLTSSLHSQVNDFKRYNSTVIIMNQS